MQSLAARANAASPTPRVVSATRRGARRARAKTGSVMRCNAVSTASPGSIDEWIEKNLDAGAVTKSQRRGGSDWAEFSTYETENGQRFFVKTSRRDPEMFMGEGAGLRAMHATNTLVIPRVYYAGAAPEGCREGNSVIVMDYLDFGARGDQAEFGRQLALMHAAEPAVEEAKRGKFGFAVNNTIGDTPQHNGWMDDWVEFFRERRIGHQLKLARDPSKATK